MKGFIEIIDEQGAPVLINVEEIKQVLDNCIYLKDDVIKTIFDYSKLKQKIEEAVG